jgi:hypothetical protein
LAIFVQITAVYFHSAAVPYFPIEISRTAAAGKWSHVVFNIGAFALGGTLYLNDLFFSSLTLGWAALCIVSSFDDFNHLALHTIGVFAMIFGTIISIRFSKTLSCDPKMVRLAVFVYGARLILKLLAILKFEMNRSIFETETWFALISNDSFRKRIFDTTLNIMYEGERVCLDPQRTLMAFRLGGLLQWISFWLLISSLKRTQKKSLNRTNFF